MVRPNPSVNDNEAVVTVGTGVALGSGIAVGASVTAGSVEARLCGVAVGAGVLVGSSVKVGFAVAVGAVVAVGLALELQALISKLMTAMIVTKLKTRLRDIEIVLLIKQKALSSRQGLGNEQDQRSVLFPPPFCEAVVNPTRAGDLACWQGTQEFQL
jgi:hypothetical protein